MAVAHQKRAIVANALFEGVIQVGIVAFGMTDTIAANTGAYIVAGDTTVDGVEGTISDQGFYNLETCTADPDKSLPYGPIFNNEEELGGGYNDRAGVDI